MANQRKGKSKTSSPAKVKPATAAAGARAPAPVEDPAEWPQWMKLLVLSISVLTFIAAAIFTVAGVQYVVKINGDKFGMYRCSRRRILELTCYSRPRKPHLPGVRLRALHVDGHIPLRGVHGMAVSLLKRRSANSYPRRTISMTAAAALHFC